MMDQLSTSIGISYFRDRQPQSLEAWNAQYEALSFENDWWFKTAVAVGRSVRAAFETIARATAPAPQFARP
jgi:hypothetical protein